MKMETETHEKARIAVDAVIFTIHDRRLKVLLAKREKEPFKGRLELFGGLLHENETAEDTLRRKLAETLGKEDSKGLFFQQFFTFTAPSRDPRERTISIGYITLINSQRLKSMEDWHDCKSLPELAFDHNEMVEKARAFLKENMGSQIVKQFMPYSFPLNSLQEAYEVIEGNKYDNRNFRKKMLYSEAVEDTKKLEKEVSHRPAKLFRFRR
jgi:8-oxo-dGTP diphosphatase